MPASEMNPASVICVNCRRELAPAALFCPSCGTPRVRDAAADELVGKVLGERFLVQERMGHGKSGSIYRAEHVTLRRKVAIKVLHHELSRDDLAIERFRREATSVAEIDNEHIVEIHDFGRTPDGRLYLAMELLEGETLDTMLTRDGRMTVDRAVDVMMQLGEALSEAHSVGFVHRDLRPRNVFLAVRRGKANFVKLLDFGLSKLVESGSGAASTSLGMTFGDPRYMSPEQAKGDAIDRRADIYSLGCIAYEMLTGEPPFTGGKVFDVLTRHVSEAPRSLKARLPGTPEWLEVAVMRSLAKRPEDRYVTAARLVEALRVGLQHGVVLADEPAAVPPPVAAEPSAAHSDRRGPTGTPAVGVPAMPAASDRVAMAPVTDDTAASQPTAAAPGQPPAPAPVAAVTPPVAVVPPPVAPPPVAVARLVEESRDAAPHGPIDSNISGAWFADGDGAGLGESQVLRLERARGTIAPGDSLYDDDLPSSPGPLRKILLIAGGGLAVLVIAVHAFAGGGGDKGAPRPAAGTGGEHAAAAIDAGAEPIVAPAAAVDAGVASDAAARTAVAPDAPARTVARTATPAVERTPAKPTERTPARTLEDQVPPGGTGRTGAVDEEAIKMAEFYAKAGEAALRGGDPVGAAGNFQKALASNPGNVDAVIGLGDVALQQGLYNDALRHLKTAAKLAPRRARVHTLLGEAHLNSGNAAAAEQAFKKALQIDPDDARARNGYNEAAGRLPPPIDDD